MSKLGRELCKAFKKKKISLFERIYLSDAFDVIINPYYKVRHFINKVVRTAKFLTVIWNTENWDSAYMLEIWIYALKDLRYGIYDKGHHVVTKQEKRDMNTVITLLGRMARHEEYTKNHHIAFNKKWGRENVSFEFEEIPGTEDKPGGPYSRFVDRQYETLSEDQKKQYVKEFRVVCVKEKELFEQDVDLFCKLLKKNLLGWWT
jgi:hypothetical protein